MDAFCLPLAGQKTAVASSEFLARLSRVPGHGLGLSLDVYVPDALEVVDALHAGGLGYDYLELFRASPAALANVRRRLPSAALEYHGEGIWLTQPDLTTAYPYYEDELRTAAAQAGMLGSTWINYECAAKQIAGYSFGTYLPPLFTRDAAAVTAHNAREVQRGLDRMAGQGPGPLLLIELPPLTYFKIGTLPVEEYFRIVTESASCGLVLDVGHLWTVYRYGSGGAAASVHRFVSAFLDRFPLERVVQIHVAGLGPHGDAGQTVAPDREALWIDAHGAPIPEVLLDMLDQILAHPRLRALRGVALEVDTKPAAQIVAEFDRFSSRFGPRVRALVRRSSAGAADLGARECTALAPTSGRRPPADRLSAQVLAQYAAYARLVAGRTATGAAGLPEPGCDESLLKLYSRRYLPHEILSWGGDLRDLFPATCRCLSSTGVALDSFLEFWFRGPRTVTEPYDFFLLKLARFVEFVGEVLPSAAAQARQEAAEMRLAYRRASEDVGQE